MPSNPGAREYRANRATAIENVMMFVGVPALIAGLGIAFTSMPHEHDLFHFFREIPLGQTATVLTLAGIVCTLYGYTLSRTERQFEEFNS